MVGRVSHSIDKAHTGRSDQPPEGVRLARPGDEERLFDLCRSAFLAGDGIGTVDQVRAREAIHDACHGKRFLLGLIEGPERIEGLIGFEPCRTWYGDDDSWYWIDMMLYVHPDHRNGRHGARLLAFGEWWAAVCGAPVFVGLMPRDRMDKKIGLFSRHAEQVGATFLLGDGRFRYSQTEAA